MKEYLLHIEGPGYLANVQGLTSIKFTATKDKARVFTMRYDNPIDKLAIWNAEAKRMFNNSNVTFNIINL